MRFSLNHFFEIDRKDYSKIINQSNYTDVIHEVYQIHLSLNL